MEWPLGIPPRAAKLIVFAAAGVPVYVTVSASNAWLATINLGLVTALISHLYYGYNWAKWTAGVMSLAFGAFQVLTISPFWNPLAALFWVFSLAVMVNAALLLRAKVVRDFLTSQHSNQSVGAERLLKLTRWMALIVVAGGVLNDIRRLLG